MTELHFQAVQDYRKQTFRLFPGAKLASPEDAVAFVQERGFIYFWPINGVILPSLWTAVAGDRPVPNAHDDPGHITWGWKDQMLGKRRWYYAKVLRKKATIISLETAPFFYALSENYGAPDEDYLTLYEQGRLTLEAKLVYEALLDEGPLDTIALRRATRMSSPESEGRFNRALSDLQADFKILPVGVTQAGAWHYAFAYDTVAHHFPDLPDQAHLISESQAQRRLCELYFHSVGAAQVRDAARLLGWNTGLVIRVIDELVEAGSLQRGLEAANQPGEWAALAGLVG